MGLQQIIPGVTFTDPTLPMLTPDTALNAGSIWLLDANHPAGAWPESLTGDVSLPNIAALRAGALVSDREPGSFSRTSTWVDDTHGKVEKTSKGALHVIVSRENATEGVGCSLDAPQPGVDYLRENWEHDFYFSLWLQPTRRTGSGAYPYRWIAGSLPLYESTPSDQPWFAYLQTGMNPTSGARFLGRSTSVDIPGTPGVAAVGVKGASAEPTSALISRIIWGAVGALNPSLTDLAALASFAIERYYAEDLTVSGRSYEEAVAADIDLHLVEHSHGGRYFNDTFTDPATIP